MIFDLPEGWKFLTYYGLKSHLNVDEGLEFFAKESINVGKEEDGTNTSN